MMYDVGGWRDERVGRFCVSKFIINFGRMFHNLGEVESQ